jgi:uncharacterized protein YjiS (DUF1127 family)
MEIIMLSTANARPSIPRSLDTLQLVQRAALAFWTPIERMRKRQEERRAIHAMSTMSDHLLRDLGIGRSQIVRLVKYGRADGER